MPPLNEILAGNEARKHELAQEVIVFARLGLTSRPISMEVAARIAGNLDYAGAQSLYHLAVAITKMVGSHPDTIEKE